MKTENESYKNLVDATPEELLEAAINFYIKHNPDCERWLRLGFALAQLDGWQQVAPAWLSDWLEDCKNNQWE